jgi:hypothetical protein
MPATAPTATRAIPACCRRTGGDEDACAFPALSTVRRHFGATEDPWAAAVGAGPARPAGQQGRELGRTAVTGQRATAVDGGGGGEERFEQVDDGVDGEPGIKDVRD